jgi:hypothetical protein
VSCRRALLLLPVLAAAPGTHAETLYVIEQLVVSVNSAPDGSGERVASIKSGDAVEALDRQGDQVHVHLANGTEGWIKKSYLSAEEPLQHRLGEQSAEVERLKQDVKRLEAELATAQSARSGTAGDRAVSEGIPSGGNAQTNGSPGTGAAAGVTAAMMPGGGPSTLTSTSNFARTPGDARNGAAATRAPQQTSTSAPGSTTLDPKGSDSAVDPTAAEPSYFMTPPEAPARPAWHWALGSSIVALALGFALGWHVLDRRIRHKYGGLRIY